MISHAVHRRAHLWLALLCSLKAFAIGFSSDSLDALDVDASTAWLDSDLDVGPNPNKVVWTKCADEGELCDCTYQHSKANLMRFGNPGGEPPGQMWDYAHVVLEAYEPSLLCHPISFMHRDPAPGYDKMCQCAHFPEETVPPVPAPPPPALDYLPPGFAPPSPPAYDPSIYRWSTCADEGDNCRCAPGSLVRYGWTGSADMYANSSAWFRQHPEVTRWAYHDLEGSTGQTEVMCLAENFENGKDPFPGYKKRCQCADAALIAAPPSPPQLQQPYDDNFMVQGSRGSGSARGSSASVDPPLVPETEEEELLNPAVFDPNDYAWTKCADEGERCECENEGMLVRFGSTGEPEYYEENLAWFRARPEVRRWDYKTLDDNLNATLCDTSGFEGSDPFPGHTKVCQCSERTLDTIEFSEAEGPEAADPAQVGEAEVWLQTVETAVATSNDLPSAEMSDDKPGVTNAAAVDHLPVPEPLFAGDADELDVAKMEWSFCADEGVSCQCPGGAAALRYGSTGDASMFADGLRWFRAHAEVRRWAYIRVGNASPRDLAADAEVAGTLCSASLVGGVDPFPGRKKICQCGRTPPQARAAAALGMHSGDGLDTASLGSEIRGGTPRSWSVMLAIVGMGIGVFVTSRMSRQRLEGRAEREMLCARGRGELYGVV